MTTGLPHPENQTRCNFYLYLPSFGLLLIYATLCPIQSVSCLNAGTLKSGLLLALGISVLGVSDLLVPLISDDMGLGQFHFLRSIIAVTGVLIIARTTGLGLWPERWTAVAL